MARALTLSAVGGLFGIAIPDPPGKVKCPLAKHNRKDKTFRTYKSKTTGDELWKCWSCDAGTNNSDAVGLYAALAGVDRKEAWKRLRDDGFEVPGMTTETSVRRPVQHTPSRRMLSGAEPPKKVLPLDPARVEELRGATGVALAEFAKLRGLPEAFLRAQGMVDVPPGAVGFVYTNPATGAACRIKVRTVREKRFWVEPKGADDSKALAPLYLAHDVRPLAGGCSFAVIVEGEVDALTLRYMGIPNVVSLPDGSESAMQVDLKPLSGWSSTWLVATDADAPGDKAFMELRERGRACGIDVARLYIETFDEAIVRYKDANDGLVRGKLERADFAMCVNLALESRIGFRPKWDGCKSHFAR